MATKVVTVVHILDTNGNPAVIHLDGALSEDEVRYQMDHNIPGEYQWVQETKVVPA